MYKDEYQNPVLLCFALFDDVCVNTIVGIPTLLAFGATINLDIDRLICPYNAEDLDIRTFVPHFGLPPELDQAATPPRVNAALERVKTCSNLCERLVKAVAADDNDATEKIIAAMTKLSKKQNSRSMHDIASGHLGPTHPDFQ